MYKLVYYKSFMPNAKPHYGIMSDKGNLICLCCGNEFKRGTYSVIWSANGMDKVDEILHNYKGECD